MPNILMLGASHCDFASAIQRITSGNANYMSCACWRNAVRTAWLTLILLPILPLLWIWNRGSKVRHHDALVRHSDREKALQDDIHRQYQDRKV